MRQARGPVPRTKLHCPAMLISKKNRVTILSYVFKEGVVVAKKDYALKQHPDIPEVSNLEVIKLMTSLTSKEFVTERFSWNHYYWFLTDDGIEYLREFLHLDAELVPNTLKKAAPRPGPPGRPAEGERRGPPRGDRDGGRDGYRSGPREGGFSGFGRGGGAPRQAVPAA
uniref:Plectin/eS10 N-terminal domain-containing protein n=1 Tax=Coccolithus braarudii TaxID=221442 RepID=A0A7S0LML0_9EUKA